MYESNVVVNQALPDTENLSKLRTTVDFLQFQ